MRARQFKSAKFRRQMPIGSFVVDFCCVEERLIIEIDGGQHARRSEEDAQRTAFLERSGYRLMRFWNHEVHTEFDAVLTAIDEALISSPHPDPLPAGEGS